MNVERETEIAAPPDEVYRLVMDPDRLGEWVSIHESIDEGPPCLEKGDRMIQRLKLAGRRFKVEWEIDEVERPRHVVWNGKGPSGTHARVVYGFEPLDGGRRTNFSYRNEYELPGGPLGKVAGRAVAGAAGREVKRSLERLKGLLE